MDEQQPEFGNQYYELELLDSWRLELLRRRYRNGGFDRIAEMLSLLLICERCLWLQWLGYALEVP